MIELNSRSVAASKESVLACTEGAISVLQDLSPNFILLQEVDTDSTRSYRVNQKEAVEKAFPDCNSAFAYSDHNPVKLTFTLN